MAGPPVALDVVGVGALNLDLIVTAAAVPHDAGAEPVRSRLERLVAGAQPLAGGALEWGAEVFLDEPTVLAAVEAVGASSLDATLGGSAFNTVFALTQLQRGLRLGYVGVAGRVPVPGLSSLALLARLGVDHRHLPVDRSRSCGLCFSFAADGERTLLTAPGANAGLADLIDARFDALVEYLAGSRVVHLAAPLDDRSPGRLLALVRAVRRAGPGALVSFDPGHGWSTAPAPAVHDLVRASDLVLLNHREFTALGGAGSDDEVARRLVRGSDTGRLTVVVKRPDGVFYCRSQDGAVEIERLPRPPLPAAEIEDPTGAGDVFAAGLLAVLVTDPAGIRLGSLLGIELARHKLRYVGTRRHAELAAVARTFLTART
jgi:sugar/nucleoside kinase (ribokinase family)